jgi:hypothetical protein
VILSSGKRTFSGCVMVTVVIGRLPVRSIA